MTTIRRATTDDAFTVLNILHEAYEEYRGHLDPPSGAHAETCDSVTKLLQEEWCLVAEVDGRPAGCVFYIPGGSRIYFHRLGVLPAYRRMGVGAALVGAVEERARALGAVRVTLGVRTALPANRRLYERLGYRVVEFSSHAGYDHFTFARMEKWLITLSRRRIVVVPHDPAWQEEYKRAADEISAVYGDLLVSIHHIGSTSVSGLAAKPIVDIMPVVRDIEQVDGYDPRMLNLGYFPQGENMLPGRRYFRYGIPPDFTRHVHVYQTGHPEVERHLAFCAYLRAHPADAVAYGALKMELAQRFPYDSEGYVAGKDGLIKNLLEKAMTWQRNSAASLAGGQSKMVNHRSGDTMTG